MRHLKSNHQMKKNCKDIFQDWLQKARERIAQRGGPLPFKAQNKKKGQGQGQGSQPSRAVPAIEIDTELANRQYENQNELE